mmetsp:Transcript_11764/g.33878  ORF Transcript_11764/g.33878 Transcript_11764/m.33878 type:complete len:223 (+) Transcript_11764:415-1083(+)
MRRRMPHRCRTRRDPCLCCWLSTWAPATTSRTEAGGARPRPSRQPLRRAGRRRGSRASRTRSPPTRSWCVSPRLTSKWALRRPHLGPQSRRGSPSTSRDRCPPRRRLASSQTLPTRAPSRASRYPRRPWTASMPPWRSGGSATSRRSCAAAWAGPWCRRPSSCGASRICDSWCFPMARRSSRGRGVVGRRSCTQKKSARGPWRAASSSRFRIARHRTHSSTI